MIAPRISDLECKSLDLHFTFEFEWSYLSEVSNCMQVQAMAIDCSTDKTAGQACIVVLIVR